MSLISTIHYVLNMYDKSGHCFRISLCTYLNVKIRIWIILQIFKLTAIFTCTFKEQFGLCELGVCFQTPPLPRAADAFYQFWAFFYLLILNLLQFNNQNKGEFYLTQPGLTSGDLLNLLKLSTTLSYKNKKNYEC